MSSKVRIEPSGHSFNVTEGETILDAALRQGFALPYGCRNGACGACRGKLLAGEVSYGDSEPTALARDGNAANIAYFCRAFPVGDVTIEVKEIEASKDIAVKSMPTKVARLEKLSDDVMGLWLKLPEGQRLQYLAGQYVDFQLQDGRRRAFSIANPPHADALLEFHIRRIEGGRFTEQLFADIKEKDIIRIEGPHGSFFLREDSKRAVLLLATGTGFGPIKAIVEHAIAEGCKRPIYLYWGARSRSGLYLDELARKWAAEHENIHYVPVLSRPAAEDRWDGHIGHVQDAVMADFSDLGDFELYACGHPQMVYSAKEVLAAKGLSPEHCYSDAFEYAKD